MKRRSRVGLGVAVILVAILAWHARDGERAASGTRLGAASDLQAGRGMETRAAAVRPDPRTQPRASIAGTVRDPGGAPITGARVCAELTAHALPVVTSREPRCATTDADGTYALRELLAAPYSVTAGARGYRPAAWFPGDDHLSTQLALRPGQARLGVDVVLHPGGVEVTGVVSDLGGGPIAGARVRAYVGWWGEGGTGPVVETDDRGAFSIWTRPGKIRIEAAADGYTLGSVTGGAPGDLEVLLTPESSLAGTVIDAATGAPIEGALVELEGTVDVWDEEREAVTDATGAFRIARLIPDRYTVTARTASGHGVSEGETLVGLGQHVGGVEVKLHRATRVVGRVVIAGEPPRPCPDAVVSFRDEDSGRHVVARTEPDGSVIADGVPPGRYAVRVGCRGHRSRDRYPPLVVASAQLVERVWEVESGAAIRGRVTTASGEVVEGARVHAVNGASLVDVAGDISGSDGSFELRGLRTATYLVSVDTERGTSRGVHVDVTPDMKPQLDLVVEDGGTIEGVVVDAEGVAVAGTVVDVYPLAEDGDFRFGDVKTDRAGAFVVGPLRVGMYHVIARRDASAPLHSSGANESARRTVAVHAAKRSTVELVVEGRTGTIAGVVVDAAGRPIPDAFVEASRESDRADTSATWDLHGGARPHLTSTEGGFSIDRLAPGAYTLRAYRRGGGQAIAEHVVVGASVRLQIESAGVIEGVVRHRGAAPDEVVVELADLHTGFVRRTRSFRSGGRFALRDLPAGHFQLRVSGSGGYAQLELDLAEGERRVGLLLELEALVTLTGRVVELGTQTPVAGFRMSAAPARGRRFSAPWSSVERASITDESGRFTIERVPRGEVDILGLHQDLDEAAFGWLRLRRTVDGTGTIDLGDLGVPKNRLAKGEVAGELGVHFKDQPPDTPPDQERYEVGYIDPAGPAAKTELEVGDVVVSIDGRDITGANAANASSLLRAPVGTRLVLGLQRGTTVAIVLAAPS